MTQLDTLLANYGQSHQNATNTRIHLFAVPLIMLSLCGLVYAIHPYALYVSFASSLLYYWRLSARACMWMLAWAALLLVLVQLMGAHRLAICVTIFVLAWIAQFVGHHIEGKKPSFVEDLQYLLIGPLFVLTKLFSREKLAW